MISYIIGPTQNNGSQKLSKQILGQKQFHIQKQILSKKILGQRKFGSKTILGPTKFWVKKSLGQKKIFRGKIDFESEKMLGPKKLGSQNLG